MPSARCRAPAGYSTTPTAPAPALTPGTWTNISPEGMTFSASATLTQGMALDPCNPYVLYVCLPRAPVSAIYKTTDGGSSWFPLNGPDSCVNIRVDPSDPQHLYIGAGVTGQTGFFVSHDGGETFAQPDGFLAGANNEPTGWTNDVYHVEPDPTDFDHVLLSFHSPWSFTDTGGIIESFDGGDTWTRHPPIPGVHGGYGYGIFFLYAPDLSIGDAMTWLFQTQAGGSGGGSYRTTDGGASWTQVSMNNMEHGGNQLYYTQSGVLYAGGWPQMMRSEDNGASWTTIGPNGGLLSVIGDGATLYSGLHNGGRFLTSAETNGLEWSESSASPETAEGPFEMAYDAGRRIVYSANITGGIWALQLP